MAEFALLARWNMPARLPLGSLAIVAQQAGLRELRVIHPHDFLPIVNTVTRVATICRGYMITRLERCVQQAIRHMTQLAKPWRTRKHSTFMATVTLEVAMRPQQFKPRFKVIEIALLRQGWRSLIGEN